MSHCHVKRCSCEAVALVNDQQAQPQLAGSIILFFFSFFFSRFCHFRQLPVFQGRGSAAKARRRTSTFWQISILISLALFDKNVGSGLTHVLLQYLCFTIMCTFRFKLSKLGGVWSHDQGVRRKVWGTFLTLYLSRPPTHLALLKAFFSRLLD